jgi:hypothetical protein
MLATFSLCYCCLFSNDFFMNAHFLSLLFVFLAQADFLRVFHIIAFLCIRHHGLMRKADISKGDLTLCLFTEFS